MSLRRARWVNGILVTVAVALSASLLLTRHEVTTSERIARENNVFRAWRPLDLQAIRVTRPNDRETQVVLTRIAESSDPHDFALGETEPRKADPGAVSELLGGLEYATWLRRIDPANVDRQAFGLQDPILEVRVTFRGIDYRLIIGAEAPSPPGARYAELSGSAVPEPGVGLLAAEVVQHLQVDARAFLGSQLLPYAKSEIQRIILDGEGGKRRLERDDRGWRLDGAAGPRVDSEAINNIFFQMARVSASQYVDLEEARRTLEKAPSVEVTQIPLEGGPVRVRLGGECPGASDSILAVRETDPPVAGCVPATVLPALVMTRAELMDLTPFPFQPDEVDHLTVVQGDRVIEAVRSGARFDLVRPRRTELELDAGNEFLHALVSPKGEPWTGSEPPPLARLGLDPPLGSVTLRGLVEVNEEATELTVTYGRPDPEGRIWIQRQDDGAVIGLNQLRAWAFSADDTWTRSRTLLHVDKSAIERVEVQSDGSNQVVQRRADGSLELLQPEGFSLDGGLASDWISALSDLRVVRWLRPEEMSRATAPAPGALQIRVRYRDKDEERQLAFSAGARTTGGYLAQLTTDSETSSGASEKRAAFILPASVYRTLDTIPISRLSMSPDVDNLEQLVVEAEGRRIALERRGGALVSVDGTVSPETVTALEQALGALHPEAAVHVGPPRPRDGLGSPELVLTGSVRSLDGERKPFTYRFGRIGVWQGRTVRFARADGIDATFAFEHERVLRVLDLL